MSTPSGHGVEKIKKQLVRGIRTHDLSRNSSQICETFKIIRNNPLKNPLSTGQVLKNDFGISETVAQNIIF